MPVMNPRTHPRGTRPDFTLPRPNPNPSRMTDALWWLVCMRLALEPKSRNGGTFADKPGYHNCGDNLPDHGAGDLRTDHSIRRPPDRAGSWWRTKSSAHDWTFVDAQAGNYTTINKYTTRLVNSMRDPDDLRPDEVYAYTLGQMDNDTVVEGYNEYTNMPETSADKTHNWHRHDSFRRNIIGSFWHMWKALTIDMGWTYAEWLRSTQPTQEEPVMATLDNDDKAWLKEEMRTAGVYALYDFSYIGVEGVDYRGISYDRVVRPTVQRLQKLLVDPSIAGVVAALAADDNVDEAALANALAPALAPLILAGLPDTALTSTDIEQALRNVLLSGVDPDS